MCNKLYHSAIIPEQGASKIVKKISQQMAKLCRKLKWLVFFSGTRCSVTSLLQQSLEERRKIQRLAFMYKILNSQCSGMLYRQLLWTFTLSSRPSRGADANQQKLVTVRSYTENYRQSYSIRTVKDWNALPQSVVSAGSLALFKSRLSSHAAPQSCTRDTVGVMPQF